MKPIRRRGGMAARALGVGAAWLGFITALHLHLNVGWDTIHARWFGRQELKVGFLPVT